MKNEKKVMSSVPPVGLVGSLTSEFIPAGTYVSQGLQVVRYISDQTQGYNYYLTAGPGVSTCFPSSRFPFSGSYYSPGRCPSGYYAACTRTGGNSVGDAIETTVTCCPMIPYSFGCNTKPVGSDWGVFADCTTSASDLEVDLDVIGAVPTSKLSSSPRDTAGNPILTHAIINGYGIEVRWQQMDEVLLFGSTSSSSSSSSSTRPPTTSPSTSSTMTVTPASSSSRHNSGIIAGIVVGSVVGALILLGIVIVIIRSKRKRRPGVSVHPEPFNGSEGYPGENTRPAAAEISDLGTSQTPDPPAVFPKYELPIPTPTAVIPRQELPVQTYADAMHIAQHQLGQDHISSAGGRPDHEYAMMAPGELDAMERPGELQVDAHIAELGDTDRGRRGRPL